MDPTAYTIADIVAGVPFPKDTEIDTIQEIIVSTVVEEYGTSVTPFIVVGMSEGCDDTVVVSAHIPVTAAEAKVYAINTDCHSLHTVVTISELATALADRVQSQVSHGEHPDE